jgi:hypothetical protein
MNDADRALAALAGRQRQVFTRNQAVAAGLTRSAITYRAQNGLLVPYGVHVLHFGGTTLDWRSRLAAGLLDLGPNALVTGRAAAALHRLDGYDEGPLEFLVRRSQRRRRTVGDVRSTSRLIPLDRVPVDGLWVTSGTRTALELLGRVTERELGNAIDSAIRAGITAPSYLRRRLQQLGRQGRPGVAVFDRVMESAGVQSWLERRFVRLVRGAGLPKPVTQRIYRRDGVHIARVDFDFSPAPVIVEVGGRRGYLAADDRRRQEHRRSELQLIGKIVYFFSSEDVTEREPYVVATVAQALAVAA